MALAQHMMLRLRDGRVLVRSVAERRVLVRVVFGCARDVPLLSFRAADTHLHVLVVQDALPARLLARRLESALKQALRLPVGFAPVHTVPVAEQRHLVQAFWYILRQEERHELDVDRAHEASNVPDLLGMRLLGAESRRAVSQWLPRVTKAELCRRLAGLDGLDHDGPLDFAQLGEAAAAAVALPTVAGQTADARLACAAASQLAANHLTRAQTAAALGVSARTVTRARVLAQQVPRALVEAVRSQLRIRSHCAASSEAPAPVVRCLGAAPGN